MKKYEVIYNKYRQDILNGFLQEGMKLPSIRKSCELFKASQTTVEHAYEKLLTDGYIISTPQVGYYVGIDQQRIELHKQLDDYSIKKEVRDYLYDFRSQTVSQDSFENNIWKRYLRDVLDNMSNLSTYGDPQGEYELRQALCQYAYKSRGVLSQPSKILIGSNFQSLLFILCGLFKKDMVVGMEEGYSTQAYRVFKSYGFKVVFIKSDEESMNLDDLKQYKIDVLYINSSCGGKYHRPITNKARDEILRYTAKENIVIIEDDYNGELTYVSKQRQAIQGFDRHNHVIYCGSFSRLLLPSLRISYMAFNEAFYNQYIRYKNEYGPTASKLEQLAFSQYIADGYLEKHLKKLKKEYKEKNNRMYEALRHHLDCPMFLDEAYLSYLIDVDLDQEKFTSLCEENKMAINPINSNRLSVSFASIPIDKIDEAVVLLCDIIKKC